ncbi:MAG TPA: right-handed parallel beta-helix repeat-containing protein [Solirubrobacteraceae bacterium]
MALGSIGASTASARTLVVDDNRAQCPTAAFRTIQSAVDAAAAGDTVDVCPGSYQEQVYIQPAQTGLVLESTQPRLATIRGPKSFPGDAPGSPALRAIVVAAAAHAVVRGFRILGPLPDRASCATGFTHDTGVQVGASDVQVDDNDISDVRDNCGDGTGIWAGDAEDELGLGFGGGGSVLSDNLVEQYRTTGIVVETGEPRVRIVDNEIVGAQSRPNVGIATGQEGSIDAEDNFVHGNLTTAISLTGSFADETQIVNANRIRGNGVGIETGGFMGSPALITDNDISASRADGILDQPWYASTIVANSVYDNGANGLTLNGPGGSVQGNTMLRNRGDAIHVGSDAIGYAIDGNSASGSHGLDCRDTTGPGGSGTAGTNNTWTADHGTTRSPATICTP